jgi:hypothetical protein
MSSAPHIEIDWQPLSVISRLTAQQLEELLGEAICPVLTGERLLSAQAMKLLMGVDRDIGEARAQFNQDWFRRLMRARVKAVSRLRRRWSRIAPTPPVQLGSLRRRYHANLAKYLYES